MGPIKAVTFDVWETLIHDPSGAEDERLLLRASAMAQTLRRAGHRVAFEALVEAHRAALLEIERDVWAHDLDLETSDQVAYVLRHLQPDLLDDMRAGTLGALADDYARAGLTLPPELIAHVPAVLAKCRARGLRLGVICNTGRTPGRVLRALFRDWGIIEAFDALTFSNEHRIRKPKPSIFRRTLDALGVPAEATVHVGDDAVTDVGGSKSVGMRAIHVTSGVQRPQVVAPDAAMTSVGGLPEALACWS